MKFKREKFIEWGYDMADFVGDSSLAYSPVFVFVLMAMATTSIAMEGSMATNDIFRLAWAIATAMCVDGLWLGVWLRVRSYKVTNVATGFVYAGMWILALFMFAIAAGMSILITYQQVQGIANDLLAMHNLLISPIAFIVGRGLLVMLSATVAIFFRAEKQETIAKEKKARAIQPKPIQANVQIQEAEPLAIPEVATSREEVATTGKYMAIKQAMAQAIERGDKITLTAIAKEADAGYSTVKLYAPKIKQELNIE